MELEQLVDNIMASSELRATIRRLIEQGLHGTTTIQHRIAPRYNQKTSYRSGSYMQNPDTIDDDGTSGTASYVPMTASVNPKAKHVPGLVRIVMDYSKFSHAIYADFDQLAWIDTIIKEVGDSIIIWNNTLAFGPAWVIRSKQKLPMVESLFASHNIRYQKIDMATFKHQCQHQLMPDYTDNDINPSSPDHTPPVAISDPAIDTIAASDSDSSTSDRDDESDQLDDDDDEIQSQPNTPDVTVSKWGNLWNKETRLVFEKAETRPELGTYICIGKQDTKYRKKGEGGIMLLDKEDVQVCNTNKWRYNVSRVK